VVAAVAFGAGRLRSTSSTVETSRTHTAKRGIQGATIAAATVSAASQPSHFGKTPKRRTTTAAAPIIAATGGPREHGGVPLEREQRLGRLHVTAVIDDGELRRLDEALNEEDSHGQEASAPEHRDQPVTFVADAAEAVTKVDQKPNEEENGQTEEHKGQLVLIAVSGQATSNPLGRVSGIHTKIALPDRRRHDQERHEQDPAEPAPASSTHAVPSLEPLRNCRDS